MNFAIQYLTEYRYDATVTDNLNALRVRPATTSHQRCDEFHVRIDPETRIHRHSDYFGTEVIEFGIPKAHDHLTIDVRARVVTSPPPDPPEASWGALQAPSYQEAAGEFLLPAVDEPSAALLGDWVSTVRATTPFATLRLLCEIVPDHFRYDPHATYVGSTVSDLLEGGGGVCQDFVHFGLILLRRNGIAARYVSGYLWAAPRDGGSDSMEVHTHAWLEALLPNAGGRGGPLWVGADPTNRRLAGETHVKIGHGRHYADIPPVKGVYRGTAASGYDAKVQMTRLDEETSASP
jgi:transglutaminase-like putative cysteine protease